MGNPRREKREEFGRYIKSLRERSHLSKAKVSKVLGYLSDGTINSAEQGRCTLPVDKIRIVAHLYGVELDEFLGKIQEYVPELYERYMLLKKQFTDELMDNLRTAIAGGRTDQVNSREARHHGAFGLSPEFRKLFVYIMSTFTAAEIPAVEANQKQLNLDLPFPPIPDNNLNLWENAGHA
jgi:transcriptional regulator with XRE-family HTH domain